MDLSMIINIVLGSVTLLGFGFGIWQYKSASNLKKVVNDNVRGLYRNSQRILQLAVKREDHNAIAESSHALKHNIIRLDIVNRNLNIKRIDKLMNENVLTEGEANEYKLLSSS